MKKLAILAAAARLFPSVAAAQQKPVFEIGTFTGISFERMPVDGNKETFTSIDIPEIGIFTAFFPTRSIFIQPELAFVRASGGDVTATGFALVLSPAWAFAGVSTNSFYLAPTGGLVWSKLSGDELDSTETDYMAGAKAGYRMIVRDALALHFEGAYYRRFPDEGDETNVFAIRFGIGGLLNSSGTRTAAR